MNSNVSTHENEICQFGILVDFVLFCVSRNRFSVSQQFLNKMKIEEDDKNADRNPNS